MIFQLTKYSTKTTISEEEPMPIWKEMLEDSMPTQMHKPEDSDK